MTNDIVSKNEVRGKLNQLRQKFGYDEIDLLVIENGVKTMWNLRRSQKGMGLFFIRTRTNLMPKHFADTTPEMRKVLDKIFKPISRQEDQPFIK
jgi:hypothetical protein